MSKPHWPSSQYPRDRFFEPDVDVAELIADEIMTWPRFTRRDALVPVRAEVMTLAYTEIMRLRKDVSEAWGAPMEPLEFPW